MVKILSLAFGIVVAIPIMFVAALYGSAAVGNFRYAAAVFSGVVDYDRVLASRRWHVFFDAEAYDCTFAAVRLSDSAKSAWLNQDADARMSEEAQSWRNGEWTATTQVIPDATELLAACQHRLNPEVYEQMMRALSLRGGRVKFDWDTLSVYSKPAEIAYLLRYGD
jgi:hypothetical protein